MAKKTAKKAAKKVIAKKAPAKGGTKSAKAAKPAKKVQKPAKAAPKAPAKAAKPTKAAATNVPVEGKKITARASTEDTANGAVPVAAAPKAPKTGKTVRTMVKSSRSEKTSDSDDERRWMDLHNRHGNDKALTYDMKATFEAGVAIQHKILGWGWILSSENDRLEVLFKDGRRILISNYNPSR